MFWQDIRFMKEILGFAAGILLDCLMGDGLQGLLAILLQDVRLLRFRAEPRYFLLRSAELFSGLHDYSIALKEGK